VRRTSAERTRRYRERHQLEMLLTIPGGGADVTPDVTPARVTVTPEERKREPDSDSDFLKEGSTQRGVSQRCALSERPSPAGIKVKRANLIKTLRRWARLSPRLAEDERLPRLQMLDRAEFALDDWDRRPVEDKRCFDILAARARASPLDDQVISWVRKAETPQPRAGGLRPLGHVLNLSDGR